MNVVNCSNISNSNQVSFNAKFAKMITVKKYNSVLKKSKREPMLIAKLNLKDKNDLNALCNVDRNWEHGMFIAGILQDFLEGIMHKNADVKREIYVVTSRYSNLNKLNYKKIFGIFELQKEVGKNLEIKYIEVHPKHTYDKNSKYSEVGGNIIKAIKSVFNVPTDVRSLYSATGFYEKNGFKLVDADSLLYRWIPLKKKH